MNKYSDDFLLENMRASFVYVAKPRVQENADKTTRLEYQLTLLYPKATQLSGIRKDKTTLVVGEELSRIATEHWGEKATGFLQTGVLKNPMLDGDGPQGVNKTTGVRHPGYEGHKFIRTAAKEAYPPTIYGKDRGADGKPVKSTDPALIYPGCYVHALVRAYTWENPQGGKGISFGLQAVQFAKDGDRIGSTGKANPDDYFAGAPGEAAAEAKTGAGAGGFFS